MNINATLLGQMITFAIFVWFTMRFIWPELMSQLNERKKRIADGIAAAEEGQKLLLNAEENAKSKLEEAKQHSYKLLQEAELEAMRILESSRTQARKERDDIIAAGQAEIKLELNKAKASLQKEIAGIVVLGAEKILERSINPEDHKEILNQLAKSLA